MNPTPAASPDAAPSSASSRRRLQAARALPAPDRVLVKAVNWLGDLVMSLPALRALRAAYPRAWLAVLVKQELAGFYAGSRWIDELLPYRLRRGLAGLADRRKVVREIRERRFDLAVIFPNSFQSALWPMLARIPARVGFSRDARGLLLTHKATPARAILEGHQVHYYLHLLRETLNIPGDPSACRPEVDAGRRKRMAKWLAEHRRRPGGKLVALAAGAAYGPAKEWPVGHFAALVDLLADRLNAECVLTGAAGERARSQEVAAASRQGALVAAGETDVAELLALLSLCDAFAGNDSGAMHAAGALGLPTVGIFGSTRADRTGPLGPRTRVLYRPLPCSPCLARTCRRGDYECLKQIRPEEVFAALTECMAGLQRGR